jgi:hypothetical protein
MNPNPNPNPNPYRVHNSDLNPYPHNKVIHPGLQDHEADYYREWKQCLASTRHTTPEYMLGAI